MGKDTLKAVAPAGPGKPLRKLAARKRTKPQEVREVALLRTWPFPVSSRGYM